MAKVKQEGRLMGSWPCTVCWLQSLPVFAGHQIVHSGPLTNEASVPIPHLSLAICACGITLTNERMRCWPGSCLSRAEWLLGCFSFHSANVPAFSLKRHIFSYKTTEIPRNGMHSLCSRKGFSGGLLWSDCAVNYLSENIKIKRVQSRL